MSNISFQPPHFEEWLTTIGFIDSVLLISASVCTIIVIAIAFVEIYFVSKYISSENVRHYLTWLIFMLPITTLTSAIGMFFPRSSMFLNILGVCYLMIALTIIIRLMENLFGSRRAIVTFMNFNNLKINPNSAPFFPCFCHCIPQIKPSTHLIYLLEWLVYQTAFVRLITGVAVMIGFLENGYGKNSVVGTANVINIISVTFCIYGCEMLKKIGKEKLAPEKFSQLYVLVNVTQTVFTVQKVICDLLLKYNILTIGELLTPEARSLFTASFIYCIEAFILSVITLFILNPNKNALFDRFGNRIPRFRSNNDMQLLDLVSR
uniref:Organic solute transporter subunit alpha n=1 Tax=Panagrolaimus sp. PS1159 TaxID=55785 RepID=A0AC35EZ53_9BILA